MAPIKLTRDQRVEGGRCVLRNAFRHKTLSNGQSFDFDRIYTKALERTIIDCGMSAPRADGIAPSHRRRRRRLIVSTGRCLLVALPQSAPYSLVRPS